MNNNNRLLSLSSRVLCTATVRRLRTERQTAFPTAPPMAVVRTRLRPLAFQCRHRLLTLTCVGSL